jgi:hypothetical protein
VSAAAAAYGNPFSQTCQSAAAKESPACKTSGENPVIGKNGILYKVSRVFAVFTGIGAVIVIVIGGFMYVTSGGDPQKATNGRHMIIGAGVGLVIVVFAETILVFIINIVN